MNIRILCVGKIRERYFADAMAEYAKRLSAYCSFQVVEVRESPREDISQEGEDLLKRIRLEDTVVVLDVAGNGKSSEELAAQMARWALTGKSNVTFVIGGSLGLSEEVKDRGDLSLSFSRMTFPHQLMRVILAEQVYRCFKINRGEKYHK